LEGGPQGHGQAAHKVITRRAICLRDIELKIQAWGFLADVKKPGEGLADLANWQPIRHDRDSEFIASLRDDLRFITRLVRSATTVVRSIEVMPLSYDKDAV
jgi:hypothetical protein